MNLTHQQMLRDRIRSLTGIESDFTTQFADSPFVVSGSVWKGFEQRHDVLRSFQRQLLDLFFASLAGDADPDIARGFFRDLPTSFGEEFHRSLPRERVREPYFFRTDESVTGKIFEIQCPGSGWGEHTLLHEFYRATGSMEDSLGLHPSLASQFNRDLVNIMGCTPIVQHFMENSSCYLSNLLHIAYSRAAEKSPKYWGFDTAVRADDCNFVRTHLFVSLLAEVSTTIRLERWEEGRLEYDYPPVCVFDQKLPLALPFAPSTAVYFSDAVRELFPFTSVIGPSFLRLSRDHEIAPEEFLKMPPRDRKFWIKYGGVDPSINWGSRGIFHAGELNRPQLGALLERAIRDHQEGKGFWLLQQDLSTKDSASEKYVKIGGFYGPSGFYGAHRLELGKKKVHAQSQTLQTILVTESDISEGKR